MDVHEDDDQAHDDIEHGHEGHQLAGHRAHALDAADEHDAREEEQSQRGAPFRTLTVLARFTLMALAWTMAPMPKQVIMPNRAKDVASQV